MDIHLIIIITVVSYTSLKLITCHIHTSDLSGSVVGGVASAVLAAILVIVLLSVCKVINCYKNRNQ